MEKFEVISERQLSLGEIPDEKLAKLVAYWTDKKGDLPFALRQDIDPAEIIGQLGQIRLIDIEAGGVFRFRLYGSNAVNPDQVDMTGRTTREYNNVAFGDMVTRHYAEVAADGRPRCWHIEARVTEGDYEYLRVVLPISRNGTTVDSLLVSSSRIKNPLVS